MPEKVLAPLSGTIADIKIEAGATVEEDEEILVIEAMKMETPVYCPCSGVVKEVRVKKGDEVEEEDVLAIIGD